jgi:hypothetical protein
VKPIAHFEAVWQRCAQLSALQAYLATNVAGVLQPEEILRAEWVARVSALDLYIHELVGQRMLDIFEGTRPATPAFLKFELSADTLQRIHNAATAVDKSAAFDLEVRAKLSRITYQFPEDIADGLRLCSSVELWNEVAMHLGATPQTKASEAKSLKKQLTLVIRRRNKIAHEGDLQPYTTIPWGITQVDVAAVATLIDKIVRAIDKVA